MVLKCKLLAGAQAVDHTGTAEGSPLGFDELDIDQQQAQRWVNESLHIACTGVTDLLRI